DISTHCRIKPNSTRTETSLLSSVGFIQKKSFYKDVEIKGVVKKKKVIGWVLNKNFVYLTPLYDLLVTSKSVDKKDLTSRIKKTGKVKMLVVAGAFLKDDQGRLDMLVVGDNISSKKFENVIRGLESEIGKELRYSAFTTDEFK